MEENSREKELGSRKSNKEVRREGPRGHAGGEALRKTLKQKIATSTPIEDFAGKRS